jgi:protein phosphatase
MGGYVGGEIAAQTAIATITTHAKSQSPRLETGHLSPTEFLTELIVKSQDAIMARVKSEPSLRGMGTTIVLFAIVPSPAPTLHIAHLGDSRAYRFRAGTLSALTKDHTLIEQYLSHGILTAESAKTHPERHVLTRALGMSSPVKPTLSSYPLQPDDLFVLCTDGLTKMLEDDQIQSICTQAQGDPLRTRDQLIDAALQRGGDDNVTVVVVAHS